MNGVRTDPEAIQQYQTAIAEGRDETLEILQYRKDGTPFRAMLFASPLGDGQGTARHHFSPTSTSPGDTMPKRTFGRSHRSWRSA